MCEGLPCIGADVVLLHAIQVSGVRVPSGSIGKIRQEFLREHKVLVYFDEFQVAARLAVTDLGEVRPA